LSTSVCLNGFGSLICRTIFCSAKGLASLSAACSGDIASESISVKIVTSIFIFVISSGLINVCSLIETPKVKKLFHFYFFIKLWNKNSIRFLLPLYEMSREWLF